MQPLQLPDQLGPQLRGVPGRQVGQPPVLGVPPVSLDMMPLSSRYSPRRPPGPQGGGHGLMCRRSRSFAGCGQLRRIGGERARQGVWPPADAIGPSPVRRPTRSTGPGRATSSHGASPSYPRRGPYPASVPPLAPGPAATTRRGRAPRPWTSPRMVRAELTAIRHARTRSGTSRPTPNGDGHGCRRPR